MTAGHTIPTEMLWVQLDPRVSLEGAVGILPTFLDPNDPRGACEQFDANYCGGWRDSKIGTGGFTLGDGGKLLLFPEDPPLHALAMTMLRDELIIVYQHAYVAVAQKDTSFRVSRLD